jgi:hypothetical protein
VPFFNELEEVIENQTFIMPEPASINNGSDKLRLMQLLKEFEAFRKNFYNRSESQTE